MQGKEKRENHQFVGEDRHEAQRGTRRETKAFINSNMQKTRRGKGGNQGVEKETTPVRSRARLEAPDKKKSRHFVPFASFLDAFQAAKSPPTNSM